MPIPIRRAGFTLRDVVAVTFVVGLLLVFFLPTTRNSHESVRRNQCANMLKQIGLALQNHHDAFKRFPALSSQGDPDGSVNIWATAPGQTFAPDQPTDNGYHQSPAEAAGYSWIVRILPYIEETTLYNSISQASGNFQYEAFSTTGADGQPFGVKIGGVPRPFAAVNLDEISCPTYAGDWISTASSGTAQPPAVIPAYAKLFLPGTIDFDLSRKNRFGVAITNYVALSATHLACMATDPAQMNESNASTVEEPNGTIVPGHGIRMKQVSDGTSKTVMVCESKEPAVNSWYDGTVAWCVGINPNGPQPQRKLDPDDGSLGFLDANGGSTALNVGPAPGKSAPLYAPHGTTAAQTQPVSWGPSSDHTGGVVLHLAVDGSVHAITPDIDPTLYLRLITRAGGEPQVQLPDVGN